MATLTADPEDLFAPDVIADPYTYFGRLRETDPVHWNPRAEMWILTRYEDLVWLLRHHELFSSAVIRTGDFLPGIAAVVITMSAAATDLAISSRCFW